MHSNTPYPGSRWQRWHRDGGGQGAATHLGRSPGLGPRSNPRAGPALRHSLRFEFCATGIKFPLCDTSEENGAFEVVPGTHHLEDYYSP